eukprot:UN26097
MSWPPIHRHHIHLYNAMKEKTAGGVTIDNLRIFARHGDDECAESDVDPPTACYYTKPPDGYGYVFPGKTNIEFEFNDDRPVNSEPISYYFQM